MGLKMVVGTDAHYLKKEDRYVHKSYLNSKQEEREVDDFYEYAYMQSPQEVREHFKKRSPKAVGKTNAGAGQTSWATYM